MALNFRNIATRHGADLRNKKNLIDTNKFAKFLWGDIYYNLGTRKFSKKPSSDGEETVRSFVHFVMEPFYKLFTTVMTAD